MEPMTLGSAPSSPSSPGANSSFLPAFLMGDTSQPLSPNPNPPPGFLRTPHSKPNSPFPSSRHTYDVYNQTFDNPRQPLTPQRRGPPNQGLFETLEQTRKPSSPIMESTAVGSPVAFGSSRLVDDSFNYSRNVHESWSANHRIDTHWVTVFGFPPSAMSLVLAQMSSCGTVVEKRIPPQGNWVHVKFNNLSDVHRALSLNGRCVNNNIMIGVSLYYNNNDYNKEDKENISVYTSPIQARSLRQSFVSPLPQDTSILSQQNVPQKSTGLVSKAIEYVFGW